MYLKRMYGDDPSFKGTKVVYSVLPGKISTQVDQRILTKLKADGFSQRDLKKFSSLNPDTDMLHRMAIDFSHAVIINDPDVSPDLLEYVKASGKPFIVVNDLESAPAAYEDFYKSL